MCVTAKNCTIQFFDGHLQVRLSAAVRPKQKHTIITELRRLLRPVTTTVLHSDIDQNLPLLVSHQDSQSSSD